MNDWSLDWVFPYKSGWMNLIEGHYEGLEEDEYYGPLRKLSGRHVWCTSIIWRSMKDKSDFAKIALESPYKKFDLGFLSK